MTKKELTDYKIMTIKLLIKAAKFVIEEYGIDNLTIRKVGDKAGYNSATIYNYFENIEHLKIFVFLFDYDEYISDLENYVDDSLTSLENYHNVWECYAKHNMINIDAFYSFFFNNLERNIAEYIDEYYQIFPVKKVEHSKFIEKMLESSSLESRNIYMLQEIANDGFLDQDKLEWVNDLTSYSHESILYRVYKGKISRDDGADMILSFVDNILQEHIIKK